MLPSFIDFEASSLSADSYPIEVAWNLEDGSIESYLISPAGVREWTDWSAQSEQIHKITLDEIISHGQVPSVVCRRMNRQLAAKVVYSDAPDFDGAWLARLFKAAAMEPGFTLGSAMNLIAARASRVESGQPPSSAAFAAIQTEARRRIAGRHRAGPDVQCLIECWKLACWQGSREG